MKKWVWCVFPAIFFLFSTSWSHGQEDASSLVGFLAEKELSDAELSLIVAGMLPPDCKNALVEKTDFRKPLCERPAKKTGVAWWNKGTPDEEKEKAYALFTATQKKQMFLVWAGQSIEAQIQDPMWACMLYAPDDELLDIFGLSVNYIWDVFGLNFDYSEHSMMDMAKKQIFYVSSFTQGPTWTRTVNLNVVLSDRGTNGIAFDPREYSYDVTSWVKITKTY